jgi:hypothetical protein
MQGLPHERNRSVGSLEGNTSGTVFVVETGLRKKNWPEHAPGQPASLAHHPPKRGLDQSSHSHRDVSLTSGKRERAAHHKQETGPLQGQLPRIAWGRRAHEYSHFGAIPVCASEQLGPA